MSRCDTRTPALVTHAPASLVVVSASSMQMLAGFGSKGFADGAGAALQFNNPYGLERRRECVQACMRACMHAQERNALGRKCMHTCVCMHAFVTPRKGCEAIKALLYLKNSYIHQERTQNKMHACAASHHAYARTHVLQLAHVFLGEFTKC